MRTLSVPGCRCNRRELLQCGVPVVGVAVFPLSACVYSLDMRAGGYSVYWSLSCMVLMRAVLVSESGGAWA